jgi:hypothetical protein
MVSTESKTKIDFDQVSESTLIQKSDSNNENNMQKISLETFKTEENLKTIPKLMIKRLTPTESLRATSSRMRSYTPQINEDQFSLRVKDPVTGRLFTYQSVVDSPEYKMDRVKTGSPTKTLRVETPRDQSSTKLRPSTPRIASNDLTYKWKNKDERNPVQLAPDRSYINTYMVDKKSLKRSSSFQANINSIYRPPKPKESQYQSTREIFNQIFDMNNKFISAYLPHARKHSPTRVISTKSHILPGRIALETSLSKSIDELTQINQQASPRTSTRGTLQRSKTQLFKHEPHQFTQLKNPESANSYLYYLKIRSNSPTKV